VRIGTLRHESPLGCWTRRDWRPEHLAGVVDHFWFSEGVVTHPRERILPNGMVELIVNLGEEPYRLVEGAGSDILTSCLSGVQSAPLVIEGPARHTVLGVRLHPARAYALLARPMREVSGLTADLLDLVGPSASELTGRCHDAASVPEIFRVAARWVAERVARAPGVDPSIAWAAARIEGTGGAVSITELRQQAGLSKARLTTLFREQIGVAPKLYARIVRFRRVLAMLDAEAGPLAAIALDAGYYDQPHMNAEFRELAGVAPRDFLATRYPGGVTAADPSASRGDAEDRLAG